MEDEILTIKCIASTSKINSESSVLIKVQKIEWNSMSESDQYAMVLDHLIEEGALNYCFEELSE